MRIVNAIKYLIDICHTEQYCVVPPESLEIELRRQSIMHLREAHWKVFISATYWPSVIKSIDLDPVNSDWNGDYFKTVPCRTLHNCSD